MIYGNVTTNGGGVVFTHNTIRSAHGKDEVALKLSRIKPGGLWRLAINHGPSGPMVDMETLMEGLQQRASEEGIDVFYAYTMRD